ncbi:MAG TPA: methionyl-tRNA formyltransferase [Acidimicrobiales bacterium]|nr:methionyl-tRNA formyltransferase [Acidimicrobiales bacterium]
MKLVFLGTPAAAVPPLEALVAAGHDVRLVVTQPDRKRGRGGALVPSPVKTAADRLGLPVTERVDDVLDTDAELGVVVAFGKLVKAHVLDRLPMVNLHFSLLPRWRGAAPVERAILAGDTETGVCLMALDVGLDTGPVDACEKVAIAPGEPAADLRDRLVGIGTRLLVERLATGLGPPVPQHGETTYAAKLEPTELELDFTRPAEEVNRVVRLGRAWTTFRGRRLQVLSARPVTLDGEAGAGAGPGTLDGLVVTCAPGTGLELATVKPEGRPAVAAAAWRNGARPAPGERLGG